MRVEIGLPEPMTTTKTAETTTTSSSSSSGSSSSTSVNSNNEKPQIYLEGLKGYPDERCHPEINGSLAVFRLSLSDFYECGVTRMVNQLTVCKLRHNNNNNKPQIKQNIIIIINRKTLLFWPKDMATSKTIFKGHTHYLSIFFFIKEIFYIIFIYFSTFLGQKSLLPQNHYGVRKWQRDC